MKMRANFKAAIAKKCEEFEKEKKGKEEEDKK